MRAFAPRARAAYDGLRPYRNYLFTIARNLAAFAATLDDGERDIFQLRLRQGLTVEVVALRLKISEHRVKRSSAALKKRFFNAMRQHGYFAGYRYGRDGIERAVTLLLLLVGGAR